MKKSIFICFVLACFSSCSQSAGVVSENEDGATLFQAEKVLFIGNSHTYYNNGVDYHIGKILEDFSLPFTPMLTDATEGGYTLRQHLNDQNTLDKIRETDWDVVVFQENTSVAANESDQASASIQDLSLKLDRKVKLHLFMTWPYENEPNDYMAIKALYEEVGPKVKANIVPVAVAFQEILAMNELNIDLYAEDGVHTTLEGTFLAAAMFTMAIYDIDPTKSTYTAGLPKNIADNLKTKAKKVYQEYTSQ